MKPSELTKDQVLDELEELIQRYPDRNGSVVEEYDTNACVYYLDADDRIISLSTWDPYYEVPPVPVKPVCIVGQWIETYHPEFKEDEIVKDFLLRNATISSLIGNENPFSPEVKEILANAQNDQDIAGNTWGNICLDK